MSLERFSKRIKCKGAVVQDAGITVSRTGGININKEASKGFTGYSYVDLYFDEEGNRIALKPVGEKQIGTYTLTKQTNYEAFKIPSCLGFLNTYNISFDTTRQYPAVWEDDMLVASGVTTGEVSPYKKDMQEAVVA